VREAAVFKLIEGVFNLVDTVKALAIAAVVVLIVGAFGVSCLYGAVSGGLGLDDRRRADQRAGSSDGPAAPAVPTEPPVAQPAVPVLGDGTWSPTDAFATTARVNPAADLQGNQGVWRFAQGVGLNASTYTLLPKFVAATCGIPGFEEFTVPGNLPAVGYNATGADMNSKGDCTSAVMTPRQTVVVHPWDNDVVLAWVAPGDGRVTISGRVWDADTACGEGISWQLGRLGGAGGTRLAGGAIGNGGSSSIDSAGIGAVPVARGELIVLVVAKKAEPDCDSTNVQFRINSAA
jgi:hypothetical protein